MRPGITGTFGDFQWGAVLWTEKTKIELFGNIKIVAVKFDVGALMQCG